MVNKEELLKEAKIKYPIGTVFKAVNSKNGENGSTYTQNKECYIYNSDNDNNNFFIIGSANIYSSKFKKWAEIISTPYKKLKFMNYGKIF